MVMNYKEIPSRASRAQQEQYAAGIAQMNDLAQRLSSEGLLPERFTPEPSLLHPTLEGKARTVELMIGGKSPKELLDELARKNVNISDYARKMVENPEFERDI